MPSEQTVEVTGIAHGGEGVARGADDRVIFVEGALPGERVVVTITQEKKRFLRGRATEVERAAPTRVPPPCPVAATCGGCRWQHVAPAAQIGLKRKIVDEQLRKLGPVAQAIGSPESLGYRRRARMHYRRSESSFTLGFFRRESREPVGHERCLVLDAPLNHAFDRIKNIGALLPEHGEIVGLSDGERAILGLAGVRPTPEMLEACEALLDETLVGISIRGGRQRAEVGEKVLFIDGGDHVTVAANPFSFAQAQSAQNAALVEFVLEHARARNKRVVELFAGSGNFSRALARHAQRVFTIDDDRESVQTLRNLAERHELPINAKSGKAETFAQRLLGHDRPYEIVVCDPPRAGLGLPLARIVAKLASERIVYVSCDPATLARDAAVILEGGFRIEHSAVFDLMPMTPEVETVLVFVRQGVAAPAGPPGG